MALLVDGPSCTIEELVDQDAGLLDTAQNAGINLTAKIRLAADDINNEVQAWLDRPRPLLSRFVTGNVVRLEQVVVTPRLKVWVRMHALELVYRDGYFSQLVDRYQAKWVQFATLAREAHDAFLAAGVGVVKDPMPVAAPPVLAAVAAPQQGGTFYAGVAWVNVAGQAGEASDPSSINVSDGHVMTVSAAGAPPNAIGFNVYAGWTLDALYQQNDVAVPLGTAYYWVPSTAKRAGLLAGDGQLPEFTKALPRAILRG